MDPEYQSFSQHIAKYLRDRGLVTDPARCLMMLGVAYFNLCQALGRDPFESMAEIVDEYTKAFKERVRQEREQSIDKERGQ